MQRSDFYYELPEDLVANRPCEARSGSRLLYLDPAETALEDRYFTDLPDLLAPFQM